MNAILQSGFEPRETVVDKSIATTLAQLLVQFEAAHPAESNLDADRLGDLAANFRTPADVVARSGLSPWQRRKVVRHIEDHLAENLRVAELAAMVDLCESHFARAFKASFRMAPYAYIISRRLSLSKTLMATTGLPLSEIALAVGLNDQPHLGNLFRQAFGTTPRRWRQSRIMAIHAAAGSVH